MVSSDPLSNITIGLSWPRPTTLPEPALQPKWAGEFRDHADWVSFASKRLTVAFDSNGSELKAICVDRLGRRCANGGDMRRAKDEGTFPVRYFWEMEVAPATRPQAPAGGDDAQPSEAEVGTLQTMLDQRRSWLASCERTLELLQPEWERFEARTGHDTYVARLFADHTSEARKHRKEISALEAALAAIGRGG